MNERNVYLDHAATTPIDPRVQAEMLPYIQDIFGNPSSFHMIGKYAKDALEEARARIAQIIGARADEVIFTSGGTESDNLAVLGCVRKNRDQGAHILTTRVEHQAVIESMRQLEKEGFEVEYIEVDKFGLVNPEDVAKALREDTILVSIIFGNNEIGTISPIAEIGKIISSARKEKKTKAVFHTDACQVLGTLALNVQDLQVDMMTINSSKIYGPKGVGALYVKRGLKIQPLQFGGIQEGGKRPGTENVIGIMGFARAAEIADEERERYVEKVAPLRDKLIKGLLEVVPKTRLNGHETNRLPNNVNISFMDVEGEALLLYLDAKGIYASTGSACTSATLDPSHVILALGLPYEVAHGSLRFTLGRDTTEEDIDYVIETLPPLVEKLRKISPVNVDPKYYK